MPLLVWIKWHFQCISITGKKKKNAIKASKQQKSKQKSGGRGGGKTQRKKESVLAGLLVLKSGGGSTADATTDENGIELELVVGRNNKQNEKVCMYCVQGSGYTYAYSRAL